MAQIRHLLTADGRELNDYKVDLEEDEVVWRGAGTSC